MSPRRRPRRRQLLAWMLVLGLLPTSALAAPDDAPETPPDAAGVLDPEQSRRFRAWFVHIVLSQIERPSPRWQQRDCAGLVRFAANEALKVHDAAWIRAMGLQGRPQPPELNLVPELRGLAQRFAQGGGRFGPYVDAQKLIQYNTTPVGRDLALARPGDLLFFDQGEDRHLMVWTGRFVAYHTGTVTDDDHGMRAVRWQELMQWKDTRWQPKPDNPNFAGIFRLRWLTG